MHFGIKGMKWKKHKAKSPSEILRDAKRRAAEIKKQLGSSTKAMRSRLKKGVKSAQRKAGAIERKVGAIKRTRGSKHKYKSQTNASSLRRAEAAEANRRKTAESKERRKIAQEDRAKKYASQSAKARAKRRRQEQTEKAISEAKKYAIKTYNSGKKAAKKYGSQAAKEAGKAAKKAGKSAAESYKATKRQTDANSKYRVKSRPGPGTPGSNPNTGSMDPNLKKKVNNFTKSKGKQLPKGYNSAGNKQVKKAAEGAANDVKKFFSYKRKRGNRKTNRRNSGKGHQK